MAAHSMAAADAYELSWWRLFALKFGPGNLPNVGTPLYGQRFRLKIVLMDGEEIPWSDDR